MTYFAGTLILICSVRLLYVLIFRADKRFTKAEGGKPDISSANAQLLRGMHRGGFKQVLINYLCLGLGLLGLYLLGEL